MTSRRRRSPFALLLSALFVVAACSGSSSSSGELGVDDGDGLDARIEREGWEIRVDSTGYGPDEATTYRVTSDPRLADTDGDGLPDDLEYAIRSNPRDRDTDGDGVSDADEWRRWKTSPTSVDTDGDSRGPDGKRTPNPRFFDGREATDIGTSPSLADTDGDARSDAEEWDSAFHPLIAEVPSAELIGEGEISVLLDVSYAEGIGNEQQYGTSSTQSKTTSSHWSHTDSLSESYGLEIGSELGITNSALKTNVSLNITSGYSHTIGGETSSTLQRSSSQYRTDSRTYTETTSSGTIRVGMRVRNTGESTFKLTNLSVTALHWVPSNSLDASQKPEGSFQTMATLTTAVDALTLAPQQTTPILLLEARDVNASVIKSFLANPYSLVLEPAAYDLEGRAGIDFRFLQEKTFARTAFVEIDYGGGRFETFRVATNVARDEQGARIGVSMRDVMTRILQIPYELEAAADFMALRSIRDVANKKPYSRWLIVTAGGRGEAASFDELRVGAGDTIRLQYIADSDEDGVQDIVEAHYGTLSAARADTDDDGLRDVDEIKNGWLVTVGGVKRRVYSDPRKRDSDEDGWDDAKERAEKTDPTIADTDADGLPDATDPAPLIPAGRIYVRPGTRSKVDGSSWDTAYPSLKAALDEAAKRNASQTNDDDVSQMWVARGTYTDGPFVLVPDVKIYGGFAGDEKKLGGRDPEPTRNETVLDGRAKNRVVDIPAGVRENATLDGFTIRLGSTSDEGAGIRCLGSPSLANLLVLRNVTQLRGAGLFVQKGSPKLRACHFVQNKATEGGAGIYWQGGKADIRNCSVVENEVPYQSIKAKVDPDIVPRGAGLLFDDEAELVLDSCVIAQNKTFLAGAGIALLKSVKSCYLLNCEILENYAAAIECDANCDRRSIAVGAGIASISSGQLSIINCRVWRNRLSGFVYSSEQVLTLGAGGFANNGPVDVVNSTFVENSSDMTFGGKLVSDLPVGIGFYCQGASVRNSVFWGNTYDDNNKYAPLWTQLIAGSSQTTQQSCVQFADEAEDRARFSTLYDQTNIGSSDPDFPRFVGTSLGNFRLRGDSPLIDRGTNFVDIDSSKIGIQPLPESDLDGLPRIVGVRAKVATVDIGAYEAGQ